MFDYYNKSQRRKQSVCTRTGSNQDKYINNHLNHKTVIYTEIDIN